MWIFYSIGSSFFTGITAVLAKCGIKKTDSDVFLREGITGTKIVSVLLIGIETMMMITKKDIETDSGKKSGGWLIYAVLSAVFASLTSILGKIGIEGIDSNLGTAIRTTVVLL